MKINSKLTGAASLLLSAALAPSAFAQGPMVMVGAVGGVPVLSNSLMIALGLLLAVIALRALKQNGGALKVLCLVLFGGGLAVGGIGVERSLASVTPVFVMSNACSGGTETIAYMSGATLTNNCAIPTQILSYSGLPCDPGPYIVVDGGVGTVIPPGGTVTLNTCPGM